MCNKCFNAEFNYMDLVIGCNSAKTILALKYSNIYQWSKQLA